MTRLEDPSAAERELKLQLRLAQLQANEACRDDFLTFVRKVWPDFIAGRHHKVIAEKLERVARGELKRLIINMAPRHTKSEFASYLFPAWMMGRNPKMKIRNTNGYIVAGEPRSIRPNSLPRGTA